MKRRWETDELVDHWTLLPAGLPSNVQRVLTRCLQKDLERRTRDIADVRMDLEEAEAAVPLELPARLPGDAREAPQGDDASGRAGRGLGSRGRRWRISRRT